MSPAAGATMPTAAELVTANAVELGYPTCCTTMDTCTVHVLMPPHTPQESTSAGGWQHSPDGGRALLQHVPAMSTATPVPPHTPHASTPRGWLQHTPLLSVALAQHVPEMASMKPRQHAPRKSTTPSRHGSSLETLLNSGTSQLAPPYLTTHTQVTLQQGTR